MFIKALTSPRNIGNQLFFSFFFFLFKNFHLTKSKRKKNYVQVLFWIHSDIIGSRCNVARIYNN